MHPEPAHMSAAALRAPPQCPPYTGATQDRGTPDSERTRPHAAAAPVRPFSERGPGGRARSAAGRFTEPQRAEHVVRMRPGAGLQVAGALLCAGYRSAS
jgi:hypothetical protein